MFGQPFYVCDNKTKDIIRIILYENTKKRDKAEQVQTTNVVETDSERDSVNHKWQCYILNLDGSSITPNKCRTYL
jgi:hypothetical protein